MPSAMTWLSSTNSTRIGEPPVGSAGSPKTRAAASSTRSTSRRPRAATSSAAISGRVTSGCGTSIRRPWIRTLPPLVRLTAASSSARYCSTAGPLSQFDDRFHDQPDAEDSEEGGGAEFDDPLGQVPAEQTADQDGQRVGGDHAERGAQPGAEPAVLGGQGDRREHGLVAQFGQEERAADGEDGGSGRPLRLVLLFVGELVAAQRPGAEDEEGEAGDQRDPAGGQRGAQTVADADRHQVHQRGGHGDADQHRNRLEAGGEGQRHQLRLVTELGHEDDREAQRQGREETVHEKTPGLSGPGGRRGATSTRPSGNNSQVEGLARLG